VKKDEGAAANIKSKEKKPDSKYYFFGTTPAEQAKAYVPQKIEKPADNSSSKSDKGPSAWNSGGTWEDHDMTEWCKTTLPEILAQSCTVSGESVELTVTSVEGEGSVIYSRQKAKVGFELNVKGKVSGPGFEATFEIDELDEVAATDADYEIMLDVETGEKGAVRKGITQPLYDAVAAFKTAMKMEAEQPQG
jgi:activator of HSP90 ATPase